MSPKSQEQREAADRYLREKVEEFKVRVPKGQKEIIVAHGKSTDGSLNKFVRRAIDETMERDNEKK